MVETEGQIHIELPVEKEFARLLRLMVSGIASRMNFDLDGVDDLKIAVEEAYLMAMRSQVEGPLRISFGLETDRLQIEFQAKRAESAGESGQENLGNFILDAVVDEMSVNQANGGFGLRLVKFL